MAASIVDASSMEWPTWGPSRDGTCCLVCGLFLDACVCSKKLKGLLQAAFGGDTVASNMLYYDRLLNKKTTWVRAALVGEGGDRGLRATCWICKNFLHRAPHGPSKFAREGLPVAALQKGQFRDHCGRAPHKTSDHHIGLENYSRRCSQWLRQHGPEDLAAATPQPEDIRHCLEKQKKLVDVRRANAVHLVYTCCYLKESSEEYSVHMEVGRLHGSNYYGDLYANQAFFLRAQAKLAERIFEAKWEKVVRSPVLIPSVDEADGDLGLRVQLVEITSEHTRPGSEFMDLRRLACFDSQGIAAAVVKFFTDPSSRPESLKHLVLSREAFARVMQAFLADGASVNGLTTTGRGTRAPITEARKGENVFSHLTEFRRGLAVEVPLIGVWCSPHKSNLVAEAITDDSANLPTFARIKEFLDSVSSEQKNSNKQKIDLEYLNILLADEAVKVGSLTFSTKDSKPTVRFDSNDSQPRNVIGSGSVWIRPRLVPVQSRFRFTGGSGSSGSVRFADFLQGVVVQCPRFGRIDTPRSWPDVVAHKAEAARCDSRRTGQIEEAAGFLGGPPNTHRDAGLLGHAAGGAEDDLQEPE